MPGTNSSAHSKVGTSWSYSTVRNCSCTRKNVCLPGSPSCSIAAICFTHMVLVSASSVNDVVVESFPALHKGKGDAPVLSLFYLDVLTLIINNCRFIERRSTDANEAAFAD